MDKRQLTTEAEVPDSIEECRRSPRGIPMEFPRISRSSADRKRG